MLQHMSSCDACTKLYSVATCVMVFAVRWTYYWVEKLQVVCMAINGLLAWHQLLLLLSLVSELVCLRCWYSGTLTTVCKCSLKSVQTSNPEKCLFK